MTTKKLDTKKIEFIREFLNKTDENLVREQIAFYRSLKQTGTSLQIPRTKVELEASVKKAENDYHNGIFYSMEEVFEKYKG